jgi:hypothetical protein
MKRKIFTHAVLPSGKVFDFVGDTKEKPYKGEEIIDLWCERENNGLGKEIVYAQAKVFAVPANPKAPYIAKVL